MEDFNVYCNVSENEEVLTKNFSTLRSRTTSSPQILERQQAILIEPKPLANVMENAKSLLEEPFTEGVMPLDISDFECSLCFRLFCKPVTTQCGHTYCKNCLLSSLKFSTMCPLCRTELQSASKYKYNVNIVLLNVLEKHFKEQYHEREKEDKEEEEEALINSIDIEKESSEGYYSTWTSCLIPSVRDTCCVLLSCT